MKLRVWLALVAAVLISSCTPKAPKLAFKHAEQRGRLEKNGLRFVIMPDPSTELVEVDVRYEVGSREDPPNKAGLAHLVEHMMFQHRPDGPQTKPLMHFISQSSVNMNAYTNADTTHYMINARAEQTDSMIKVEAIRMKYGCETISEEEFQREREVVRNEIRSRSRTPEGRIPQIAMSAIYPKGHAYEQTVGGDDEQLSNIVMADVCEFMKKYYAPERAIVIVAGGVEVDATAKSIQKWFSAVDKRTAAPRRKVDPVNVTKDRKTVDLDIERPWVTITWALPDASSADGEAAQFGIWRAFFDTASKADEYDCATQFQPAVLGGQEAPVFLLAMELKGMDKLDECLDFVWKASKKAYRGWEDGSWEQHEETKNRRKASFIQRLEPLFGNGGRTDSVGDMVQFTKDFDFDSNGLYVFHELDKIGKFDPARIGKVIKTALDPERARVVVFKPSKTGLKGDRRSSKVVFKTRSHDSVEQPEVDPAEARRPFRVATELKGLSGAQRFTLGNGMRVVLLPQDTFPVISAQLIFDVGDSIAADNALLASAAAELLGGPMDAEAIQRTGVSIGCGTTPDHTICQSRGMNIYLDVVIKGLERTIKAGAYNQLQIENWQKSMRNTYKLKRPQQQLEFQRQQLIGIFGPDHPYTKTGVLLPDMVGKISRDQLNSFRNSHYTAGNATLVLAGNFDPARAKALIEENFGAWSGGRDKPVARDMPKRTGAVHVGVIGDEDPQVDVAIHFPSPPGIDGQQAARQVLTTMLNDKMWEIRAKLGATYGTYARRDARLGPSLYDIGGAVDAPRAGDALKAMRQSIDDLRAGTDFDVGFVRARRAIIQKLLGESTMSAEVAFRLGFISRYNLGPNYYNDLLQQVAAVSLAQVKRLIATELDIQNEVVVLLGDRASVVKAFGDAGITDVKLVEPEYK